MTRWFVLATLVVIVCAVAGWVLWPRTAPSLPSSVQAKQRATPVDVPSSPPPAQEADSGTSESDEGLCVAAGRVIEEDTGKPQPGFTVVAQTQSGVELRTETDEAGRFAFETLTPNTGYSLLAEVRTRLGLGCTPVAIFLAPGETRKDLMIAVYQAPSAISGYVFEVPTGEHDHKLRRLEKLSAGELSQASESDVLESVFEPVSNKAIKGAHVRLEGPDGVRETTSVFLGFYEFPSLRAGHYTLTAAAPGSDVSDDGGHVFIQEIDLAPREERLDTNLYLRADGVVLSGKVVDSNGNPLAGVSITAKRCASERQQKKPDVGHSLSTRTDEGGRYRLTGLIPAHLVLAGMYMGGNPRLNEVHYVIAAQMEGHVSLEVSLPIIPASIRRDALRVVSVLVRHESGEEVTLGIAEGLVLPASAGSRITDVDFVLLKDATVGGVLIDGQGHALAGTRVRMEPLGPADEALSVPRPPTMKHETRSDGTGRFCFSGVSAATYVFEAHVAGRFRKASPDSLVVREGETLDDVRVTADTRDDRGVISGTVVSASTGKPIEDVGIRVRDIASPERKRAGDASASGSLKMLPETPGAFLIEGISSGIAKLQFSAPHYSRQVLDVPVEAGATSSVDVALEDEGILRVRATRDGQIVKADASVLADGARMWVSPSKTTKDGWQIIGEVASGGHLVRVASGDFKVQGAHYVERCGNVHVYVEPGTTQDVEIDLGGNCGLIISASGPEPIQVFVFDSAGDLPSDPKEAWKTQYARLAAQHVEVPGSVEVGGLAQGAYYVMAWPHSEPEAVVQSPITLRPGEPAQAHFDF